MNQNWTNTNVHSHWKKDKPHLNMFTADKIY